MTFGLKIVGLNVFYYGFVRFFVAHFEFFKKFSNVVMNNNQDMFQNSNELQKKSNLFTGEDK